MENICNSCSSAPANPVMSMLRDAMKNHKANFSAKVEEEITVWITQFLIFFNDDIINWGVCDTNLEGNLLQLRFHTELIKIKSKVNYVSNSNIAGIVDSHVVDFCVFGM